MKKSLFFISVLTIFSIKLVAQTILGVDVYDGTGTITWSSVKAAGKTFAWAKATEGETYTDGNFYTNIANGKSAGVVMGAYHFARPDDGNTAVNEANNFLTVASSYIGDGYLPPVLDIEDPYASDYGSPSVVSTWIQQWMTAVQNATGKAPILYTTGYYATNLSSSLHTYNLWIADPDGSPTTAPSIGAWPTWAFKQYSTTGSVSGIGGEADLDVFNGTITAFDNLIGESCTAVSIATQPQPQTVCSGGTATFSVSVYGTAPFNYYWYKGSTLVQTITNSSLSTSNYTTPVLTSGDNGSTYACTISNCSNPTYFGYSNIVTLTVQPIPPAPTGIDITASNVCLSTTATDDLGGLGQDPSYAPYNGKWVWYKGSCGVTQVGTGTDYYASEAQAGSTTYYLRAENTCGNSSCVSATVTVTANPPAPSPTLQGTTPCAGSDFTLNAGVTGTYYEWFNPSNSLISTSQNPTVSNGASGQYCLSYEQNGCWSNNGCVNVTFNPLPTPTITSSAGPYCQNSNSFTLSGNPEGGTFSGTGVSGNTFNPANANIGSNTITYSVTQNGCTGSTTQNITVNTSPTPTITSSAGPYCQNSNSFTLSGNPEGGTFSGTGVSGNTFNPANANIGSNTITYSVTQNGCTGSTTQSITVNALPTPTITSSAGPYCQNGNSITLTGNPSGGTFSGTGVSGNTFNPANANIGSNTITYSVTQNGCTGSTTQSITVNSLPTPIINVNGHILSCSPSYQSYQWYYNGSPIGGGNTQTITCDGEGNYYVSVTDNNGCTNTSNTVTVSCTGITEINPDNNIIIYPNPSNDKITIELISTNIIKDEMISMYNIEGQLLLQQPMQQQKIELDISEFAKGVYIVKLSNNESVIIKRFVKD